MPGYLKNDRMHADNIGKLREMFGHVSPDEIDSVYATHKEKLESVAKEATMHFVPIFAFRNTRDALIKKYPV